MNRDQASEIIKIMARIEKVDYYKMIEGKKK
nr:MAG TPA_asm: hypothetical protein [Caudoviricetes sp.]